MSYCFQTGANENVSSFQFTWLTRRKPPRERGCLRKPRGPRCAESHGTWSHLNNCNKNAGQLQPAQPRAPLSSSLVFTGHTVIRAPPQSEGGFDLSQNW